MPVTDFECQIARGQIGRYVDGGALSPEAMAGLEEHLGECPGCKALVAQRRAALLSSLGSEAPTNAVVSMPVENPLIAALRAKQAEAMPTAQEKSKEMKGAKPAPRYAKPSAPTGNLGKPLALAALLAVVLLGMSRLSRTVTAPSSRAAASFAADTLPSVATKKAPEAPKVAPRPAPTPAPLKAKIQPSASMATEPRSKPATKAANQDARETPPPTKPVAKPKPVVARPKPPIAKQKSAPKAKPAAKPRLVRPKVAHRLRPKARRLARKSHPSKRLKPPRSSVRVYGLDGRPLKP